MKLPLPWLQKLKQPMENNGQDATNPPWMDVDPRVVVAQLTNQLAGMIQALAMRDAYIDQLHQALAQVVEVNNAER